MSYMVEIDSNGRILIPAKLRGKLNLRKGDQIALLETDNGITLIKKSERLKEAQALFRELADERMGVEDFLSFRREESDREQRDINY